MTIPDKAYNVFEIIEDVLKYWDIYKLIIKDMNKYPGIEKYKLPIHIMKCIDDRSEYLSKKECKYVEMKYFNNKSYKQISKNLNISVRTVANWRIKILYKIAKRGGLI